MNFIYTQDVDHLKPHIVRALANAELYCMALSHLYQDPNYHNLNHWGIIQALARKGVSVAEPTDCALTESMLIQTAPLKMVSFLFCLINVMLYYLFTNTHNVPKIPSLINATLRFISPRALIWL